GGCRGEAIKGLGVAENTGFNLSITTEDGKINMNCANGGSETKQTLRTQLEALLYYDAYNPLFENADAEGWRRDRRMQVSALIDYIDRDTVNEDRAPEDYGYETLKDDYRAKDNYIDSVGELRQVRGVDDRFWTLF